MYKILQELNLIYYEYDNKSNTLLGDKNYSKKDKYNEFIKITYYLSKNSVCFFSDSEYNIYISQKNTLFTKLKNKLHSLFINLKYKNSNIFVLNDKKINLAKNIPLIKIKAIQMDKNPLEYDALIFTSKNAVIELDKQNSIWKELPTYVISAQTAKKVKELGGKLSFVGKTKYGDSFAKELVDELKGKKVLYISAKETVSNLVDILNDNNIECSRAIVYENIYNSFVNKIKIPKKSSIIFSSPSTVKYFLKTYSWDDSYKAICIGKTTAKYFPKNIKPIISDTISLHSCVRKALELK